MIAKKGSRRVLVDGVHYRWVYPRKPTPAQRSGAAICIPICAESGGATLLVELESPHSRNCVERFGVSVKPGIVATWIRQATREGWEPGLPGPQHRLRCRHILERAHPRIDEVAAKTMADEPFNDLTVVRRGDSWWPVVDGVPLLTLVRDAERPHVRREREQRDADASTLAPGDYGPGWLLSRASYLGQPQPHSLIFDDSDPRAQMTEFVDCSCGNPGFWPLMASIFCFEGHVVWANFEQIYRDWILDLGPFVFQRRLYETALNSVI